MRASHATPGDPWPPDMVITVEDRPEPLLELLWIRVAFDLDVDAADAVPPLRARPAIGRAALPPGAVCAAWESAWTSLWAAACDHAGRNPAPALHERLMRTPDGSRERGELLREIVGPRWRDRFGPHALEEGGYREWRDAMHRADASARSTAFDDDPLRRDLDAVVRAWKVGMTRIVTLPCDGDVTRRIGAAALLLTDETLASSDRFRRALGCFA